MLLPVIFFTVQKSMDSNKIINTKLVIKLTPKIPETKYMNIAAPRKARWKNVTYGCLKHITEIIIFTTYYTKGKLLIQFWKPKTLYMNLNLQQQCYKLPKTLTTTIIKMRQCLSIHHGKTTGPIKLKFCPKMVYSIHSVLT